MMDMQASVVCHLVQKDGVAKVINTDEEARKLCEEEEWDQITSVFTIRKEGQAIGSLVLGYGTNTFEAQGWAACGCMRAALLPTPEEASRWGIAYLAQQWELHGSPEARGPRAGTGGVGGVDRGGGRGVRRHVHPEAGGCVSRDTGAHAQGPLLKRGVWVATQWTVTVGGRVQSTHKTRWQAIQAASRCKKTHPTQKIRVRSYVKKKLSWV